MINIKESNRHMPGEFICECGQRVPMVLHWDFLEGLCGHCGKTYAIKVEGNMWNCCSGPENNCLYAPDGKEGLTAAQKMRQENKKCEVIV